MPDRKLISWQTVAGEPTVISGYQITPQSRVFALHFPFGGFAWNRAVAINVEKAGVEQQIPIVDATRVTQFTIYIVAALLVLFMRRALIRKAG